MPRLEEYPCSWGPEDAWRDTECEQCKKVIKKGENYHIRSTSPMCGCDQHCGELEYFCDDCCPQCPVWGKPVEEELNEVI